MPSKIDSIFNESDKIHRDRNNVPILNTGYKTIRCRGLHRALKSSFFPWRDWKPSSRGYGSSREKGKMIHRQLQHFYGCIPKGKCVCGLERFKPSKFITPIIKFFLENDIVIERTELPIYHEESQVITWIDAIGHYRNRPDAIVKISLKTGFSKTQDWDNGDLVFDNLQSAKIPCTTSNIHQMQSLCEDLILMDTYKCKPSISFVLYVYEEKNPTPGEAVVHCKRVDSPIWTKEIRTRSNILKALSSTAPIEAMEVN